MGQFTGRLKRGKYTYPGKIYVIKYLQNNLLGLPAIAALHLIKRIGAMTEEAQSIHDRYPTVFKGLGTLRDAY